MALLVAVPLTLIFGLGILTEPRISLAVTGCLMVVGLFYGRLWIIMTIAALVGLVVLSYGFNNVPLPAGGTPIPAVDVAIAVSLISSYRIWRSALATRFGSWIFGCLVILSLVAFLRLISDVPRYGLVAGRDALYVLEAWGVFVGFALGRRWGEERLIRFLSVLWRIAILWLLLYPFRDYLSEVGPVVGVQRATPLLAFSNAGFVACIALFWFVDERRRTSHLFLVLSLLVVFMTQGRGTLVALLTTIVIGWIWFGMKRGSVRRALSMPLAGSAKLTGGLLAGLLLIAALPTMEGRLGEPVGLDTVEAQIGTLFGNEGPGSGSLEHRERAWPAVVRLVTDSPAGPIIGVGYGPDLFGGFKLAGGVEVRKPHNDILEFWARTGLVGIVPWIGLIGALGLRSLGFSARFQFGWWLLSLQMTTLVSTLTQPAFGFAYRGLVYMLLVGLVWGASQQGSAGARWTRKAAG